MSEKSKIQTPPDQTRSLLDALRSDDDEAKRAALQRLYESLTRHAKQRLGAKRDRVNVMPESVVQSVIVREVADGGLSQIKDDQHLEARLKRAINNKVIDRGRKRRPSDMPVDSDGKAHEPAGHGPGPSTQLVNQEDLLEQARKLQAFHETCMAAPISETQRRFVQLSIFEEQSLEEVAAACNTSVATVKVRLSEARKKVVLHVLESLRSQVDGVAWAIIDATLVQRKSADKAAAMLGVNETQIRQVLSSIAYAWLAETYGAESIALFERLLGNKRH